MKYSLRDRRRLAHWGAAVMVAIALLVPSQIAAAEPNSASVCGASAGQGTAIMANQLDGLGSVANQAAQAGAIPQMVHASLCQP
jgi:hypothetical protein